MNATATKDDTQQLLPGYTAEDVRDALLDKGASGTIYALIMPESESALGSIVGANRIGVSPSDHLDFLEMFREPWTRKQDAMHEEYFSRWLDWASPVVEMDGAAFPYRYPTSGSSEGIFKLMSEYAAKMRQSDMTPTIHVFDGEYEGFGAFAASLGIRVERHDRSDWRTISSRIVEGQFWISQPSSIDGMVWDDFDEFCQMIDKRHHGLVEVVPDLSYVGAVARDYRFSVNHACIRSVCISHSKPFGGYYIRCGGVFSRQERPSLTANIWFKSLIALAWGTEMMRRHGVHDLPRRYRAVQEESTRAIAERLGIDGLKPCDIMVMAKAPVPANLDDHVLSTLVRARNSEPILRICLTPDMTVSIDPAMAGEMTRRLTGRSLRP